MGRAQQRSGCAWSGVNPQAGTSLHSNGNRARGSRRAAKGGRNGGGMHRRGRRHAAQAHMLLQIHSCARTTRGGSGGTH